MSEPPTSPPGSSPREALEEERSRVSGRLAALARDFDETVAASQDSNADDEHDPEGHTIAFERSQLTSLSHGLRVRLAEVDAALCRLEDGSYGTCTRCGDPIPEARLHARPAASQCVRCASIAH